MTSLFCFRILEGVLGFFLLLPGFGLGLGLGLCFAGTALPGCEPAVFVQVWLSLWSGLFPEMFVGRPAFAAAFAFAFPSSASAYSSSGPAFVRIGFAYPAFDLEDSAGELAAESSAASAVAVLAGSGLILLHCCSAGFPVSSA